MKSRRIDQTRLSLTQLALAHQRSMRTMRTWTIWGMPRNEDGSYDLAATIRWRAEHSSGPDGNVVQRKQRQRERTLDEIISDPDIEEEVIRDVESLKS